MQPSSRSSRSDGHAKRRRPRSVAVGEPRQTLDDEIEVEVVDAGTVDSGKIKLDGHLAAGLDVTVEPGAMPVDVDDLADRLARFVQVHADPRPSRARLARAAMQPAGVSEVRHAEIDPEGLVDRQRHRTARTHDTQAGRQPA